MTTMTKEQVLATAAVALELVETIRSAITEVNRAAQLIAEHEARNDLPEPTWEACNDVAGISALVEVLDDLDQALRPVFGSHRGVLL